MPVEMILVEVEQQRGLGREVWGVLQLEARALADKHVRDRSPDEGGQRSADVSGDPDLDSGFAVDRAEQLGRRRLPVGSRHGEELAVQQPPAELEFTDHVEAAPQSLGDHRRLARDTRALDDRPHPVEQLEPVDSQLDVQIVQIGRHLRRAAVGHDHLTELAQDTGGREPRPREADHQEGPGRQLRARPRGCAQLSDCW